MLPERADVVVIGGGVMGVSTAYHLVKKGCSDVLLVERNRFFGEESTGRCAGGIRYQFSNEIDIRLSLLSIPMLEHFPEELDQEIDLKHCGYLFMLSREEDIEVFRENVARQRSLGVETEWLSAEEVRRRTTLVDTNGILAGTFCARDGLADPSGVVQGYAKAATRLGASLLTTTEASGIETTGGRVCGVTTNRGKVETRVVVNAAGPWAATVGAMAGIEIPVRPLRRQIAVTTSIAGLPRDFPMVIDFAQSLYFHREGQGVLTGMSNLDEREGFDQSVDREWEMRHLEAAVARMPSLANAGLLNRWAGLYAVSPDALAILGRVPQIEGYYCINGFSGHGFMHGPICGLLIAEEILEGQARTLDIAPLRIDRFVRESTMTEYAVV
ncbi:MAG TPA: FAD-binding oxidoreductase [Anaerolineae bacterium]|nr:FAD-binding oxidoreductase [Anaerolineae bacterium]